MNRICRSILNPGRCLLRAGSPQRRNVRENKETNQEQVCRAVFLPTLPEKTQLFLSIRSPPASLHFLARGHFTLRQNSQRETGISRAGAGMASGGPDGMSSDRGHSTSLLTTPQGWELCLASSLLYLPGSLWVRT